jgi:dipeptidyl aminopeptidase/acylaminoacyl peptidase
MVSQDHRFQAAVAQRGVYDLPVFFGEGRAWRLVPDHFGGYPWEGDVPPPMHVADSLWTQMDTVGSDTTIADTTDALPPREALLRNSPITYVDQITTPLLILHADEDLRTGVIQSEALYKSLKVLGRPVEYVRYPDAGHDLSRTGDPQQRIDRLLRIYEFMERFIDSAPQSRRPATTAGR